VKDAIILVQSNIQPSSNASTISLSMNSEEQLTLLKDPVWRQAQAALHKEILKIIKTLSDPPQSKTVLGPTLTASKPNSTPKKIEHSVLDIDPLELAKQITLLEDQAFHKLPINEFLTWKNESSKQCPNIFTYTLWHRNFSTWIKVEILASLKMKKRVKVIKYFLSVIDHLLAINNYSSGLSIGTVLTSQPVTDLKKTLDNIKKEKFIELEKIINDAKNSPHNEIRTEFIPPVTIILDKIHIINQNPLTHNGRINWNKLRSLASSLLLIRNSQNYNLPPNEAVKTFIKQRTELIIQKSDLENLATLLIQADANGHSPVIPANLKNLISKFE